MEWELREIAQVLNVTVESDLPITGWSVDTRSIAPGDLFFALRGPNHDGNAYIDQAFEKGAVAAVADRSAARVAKRPVLEVPDSLVALQKIAVWTRAQWGGEVIGVTGSAGKTSTKDIIASMLAVKLRTGKTIGNLNNHVGVPLSILRLPRDAQVAVLEMGMNHAGEIRDLCAIARPQIGVVTNVGHAHIEAFDSIEGIAAAKRELIESLPADGVAVLNADDPLVSEFRKVHRGRSVMFGFSEGADARAEDIQSSDEGVRFRIGDVRFSSSMRGRHSVSNLLAGIAVAGLHGIQPEQLANVVSGLAPSSMRGERFLHDGIVILNDCYNSNPDAARAMIDVLRETPAKRRIAVLGEMLELGRWAESLHRDVGHYVASSGIDVLVGIRGEACRLVDAGDHLRKIARSGDAILFKGSRGAHVERALERFLGPPS